MFDGNTGLTALKGSCRYSVIKQRIVGMSVLNILASCLAVINIVH